MTGNQKDVVKIYVTPAGDAIIKCPDCERVRTLTVDKFRGTKHVLNVKCSCTKVFRVSLEFRKIYRKKPWLSGDYFLLSEKKHQGRMVVVNISQGGSCLDRKVNNGLNHGQDSEFCCTTVD